MKKIEVKIIEAFAVIIVCSFLPEFFPDLFGDWTCSGSGDLYFIDYKPHYKQCDYMSYFHESTTHYGFRHWTLLTMGVVLFVYRMFNVDEK